VYKGVEGQVEGFMKERSETLEAVEKELGKR